MGLAVRSQVLDLDLDQGHFQKQDPDPVQYGKDLQLKLELRS